MDLTLTSLTIDAEGVALLRMIDERGGNALGAAMVAELTWVLEAIGGDPRCRVLVLAGLDDLFCSGADGSVLQGLVCGHIAPTELLLPRVLLGVPVPTIAAMTGHAIGGGLALGLCAHREPVLDADSFKAY